MLLHKKNILNVLLVIVACVLGIALYFSWNEEIPALTQVPDTGKTENKKQTGDVYPRIAVGNYDSMTERNIFSPDRKEYIPEQQIEENDEKMVQNVVKISGKVLELYGVIQVGGMRNGLILNPVSSAEKKYRWVAVGDQIGNLRVTSVLSDRLMLRDGNEEYEIKLHDKKRREKTATSGARSKPKVVSTSVSSKRKEPPVAGKKKSNTTETKIIHTPFGDILRKK